MKQSYKDSSSKISPLFKYQHNTSKKIVDKSKVKRVNEPTTTAVHQWMHQFKTCNWRSFWKCCFYCLQNSAMNKVFTLIRTKLAQAIKLFTSTDNQNLTINWIVRFVIWYYLVYSSCDSFWRIVQWNCKQVTKDLKQSVTK